MFPGYIEIFVGVPFMLPRGGKKASRIFSSHLSSSSDGGGGAVGRGGGGSVQVNLSDLRFFTSVRP